MISVITVVKDDASGLALTFKSLQQQSLSEWELILVASPSKDNTLTIAESISLMDSRVNLITQEAQGIYEAMNLGLTQVKGSYIWFMNAGDTFASSDVLEHALMTILQTGTSLVIGGYKLSSDSRGRSFRFGNKKISRLRFAFNLRMSHQSMIFQAEAFKKIGDFDLKFRLASDFDFILKYMNANPARTTDKVYSIFRPGGAADQSIEQVHLEKHISRKENFSNWIISPASLVWTYAARVKILLRKMCTLMQISDLLNLFPPIVVRLCRTIGLNAIWSVRNTTTLKELNQSNKDPKQVFLGKSSKQICLENVVLDLKAGHCFNAEYSVIKETSNWPTADLTKGTIPRPIVTPRTHNFDTFVMALPSNGFYHWLIEDLPGVIAMREQERISAVLVYRNAPKYVFDFLKSFEIEFFEFPRFSKFTQLSIPERNQDVGEPKESDMVLLRNYFLPKVHIQPVKQNIYISRLKSKRSPVFERNLQSQLSTKGWRIVYLEEIDLLEQVTIFQNASAIVGIHGAGLSGMVFANPGTPIFELYPIQRDIKCFENLARATGLSITRIPFAVGSNEVPPDLISRLNLI